MLRTVLLLISFSGANPVLAQAPAPTPVYSMPPGAPGSSTITEGQMNLAVAKIQALAEKVYTAPGREFQALGEWTNPYFAAYAERTGDLDRVHLWGGLARLKGMTLGAMAFTLCHELGHHRGGAPLQDVPNSDWASCEGQADYFAGNCLLSWIADFGADGFSEPSPEALVRCHSNRSCALSLQASFEFLSAMENLIEPDSQVALNVLMSDSTVVPETLLRSYPSTPCRLESVFAGASHSPRPTCWYHP